MKLTKKQKGYLAVLAVALAAFLADRAFFLPDSAGAAAADSTQLADPADLLIRPTGTGSASSAVAAAARSPYRVDLLGERLSDVAQQRGVHPTARVRDAFEPSAAWVSEPKSVTHDGSGEAIQAFRDANKLKAIFIGSGGRSAVIGDKRLLEGQRIGAFTLTRIDAQSVTFAYGEEVVELPLESATSISAE